MNTTNRENLEGVISRDYSGTEDFIDSGPSQEKVFEEANRVFPGKSMAEVLIITKLLQHELAARFLVHTATNEQLKAALPSVASTSSISAGSMRRFLILNKGLF